MAQLPRVVLGSGRWGGRRAVTSIAKRPDNRWRARYRDAAGREHARHFDRKVDAQRFLDNVTAIVVMVFPRRARAASAWEKTIPAERASQSYSTDREASG